MRSIPLSALLLIITTAVGLASAGPPLQPTPAQLQQSVRSIKADSRCPEVVTFVSASPADPVKHPLSDVGPTDRIQFTLRDPIARRIYEVFTDTHSGTITEWQRRDDVESVITDADRDSTAMIVWRHAAFTNSLQRRGIDSSDVYLDLWPSQIPRSGFRFRNARVIAYQKGLKGARDFTRPIEGLVCTVNLDARRVFEFYDKEPGPALSPTQDAWKLWRERKSNAMQSVASTSRVAINNGVVRWRNWSVAPRLHANEGLVLHQVQTVESNTTRLIAHRLNVSEITEITGSNSQYWYWRHPLLVGEYALGCSVVEQDRGVDMPRTVRTMSVAMVDPNGRVNSIPDAIACYENNNALVIKSTFRLGHREIVQHYWLFDDGAITARVTIGGVLPVLSVPDTSGVFNETTNQRFGCLVAPNRMAPNRQYAVCFRLDMDVDGSRNVVSELDVRTPHESENTYHQLVEVDDYPFYRELEAIRDRAPGVLRSWKISSTENRNDLSRPTAYRLVPEQSPPSIINGPHILSGKAPYLDHAIWVTRHHDAERSSTGDYPNQSAGGAGLPTYVQNNESIRGQDVVVWYSTNVNHVPVPEDWPVMIPVTVSVRLQPDGFAVPLSQQPSR